MNPANPPFPNRERGPAPHCWEENAASEEEGALCPLHPNHLHLLRIRSFLASLPFLIGALILESAQVAPPATIVTPIFLLALAAIIRLPHRRHHARGYALTQDALRVVRGIWLHSDTIVPFNRVQHIDVDQGPLERFFGLATLTLHTAGMHNAAVRLPGIEESLARAMREEIRAHIRSEAA